MMLARQSFIINRSLGRVLRAGSRPYKVLAIILQATRASSLYLVSRSLRVTTPTECPYKDSRRHFDQINMDGHDYPQNDQVTTEVEARQEDNVTVINSTTESHKDNLDNDVSAPQSPTPSDSPVSQPPSLTDTAHEISRDQFLKSDPSSSSQANPIPINHENTADHTELEQSATSNQAKPHSPTFAAVVLNQESPSSIVHTDHGHTQAKSSNGSAEHCAKAEEDANSFISSASAAGRNDNAEADEADKLTTSGGIRHENITDDRPNNLQDKGSEMNHVFFASGSGLNECPFSDQPLQEITQQGAIVPEHRSLQQSVSDISEEFSSVDPESSGIRQLFSIQDEMHDVTDVDRSGDIVLVTGGSGFIGQHLIKLLQTQAPHVSEIWVLDIKPFQQRLEYQVTKPIRTFVGDIADVRFVNHVLKDVNSVIHVAGLVSWDTFPNYEGMDRVNVTGTVNIFNACMRNNVQRLIYCSTIDVAVDGKPIRGGDEKNPPVPPDKFLFPGYPDTKYHGEKIVLGSKRHKTDNGGKLQTVILRANVSYGELDEAYVTNALRSAKQTRGLLYQIGNGKAMFQQTYVGNTAWAFICADKAMKANPNLSEEVFYIPDNTPIQNSFNFMRPYLEARGFRLSPGYLSYVLSHSAVAAAELLVKGLSPLVKLNLPIQSHTIAYINTDIYFTGTKAKELLNYEPIFSPSEARSLSMEYYKNVDLEKTLSK